LAPLPFPFHAAAGATALPALPRASPTSLTHAAAEPADDREP
jgi:hypothetical protein